ncbi:MAG: hypothetical protein ACTSRA_00895 [Promethearchaeota archaeon]|nr:MAG: hypothetical protein [Helarchaeota virus Nidhogg Meg22_1012]URC17335.1 MAG: hypothetical protein [Helarchaeota virus Nidhogg Meg22_1214]
MDVDVVSKDSSRVAWNIDDRIIINMEDVGESDAIKHVNRMFLREYLCMFFLKNRVKRECIMSGFSRKYKVGCIPRYVMMEMEDMLNDI